MTQTTSTPVGPCRIGILGSAAIARKVWTAIARSQNATVVAVASRELAKSQAFVQSCSLSVPMVDDAKAIVVDAVGGYADLLARPDIDAVYIPLPTGLRKPWVLAAIEAGKHVLMEKPCAATEADLREMDAAATTAGVTWMDGVMFEHSFRLQAIRQALADRVLGDLRRVVTHFSFNGGDARQFAQTNVRGDETLEPHGALGDLGWYCIRMMLHVAGGTMPIAARGETTWDLNGVPGEFAGALRFADGWTGELFCSFRTANQQTVWISGSEAYMTIDDFVLPFNGGSADYRIHRNELDIDRCRWLHNPRPTQHSSAEYSHGESTAQEVRMIETFAARVMNSSTNDRHLQDIALKTQRCLDHLRHSERASGSWVTIH